MSLFRERQTQPEAQSLLDPEQIQDAVTPTAPEPSTTGSDEQESSPSESFETTESDTDELMEAAVLLDQCRDVLNLIWRSNIVLPYKTNKEMRQALLNLEEFLEEWDFREVEA